MKVTVNQELVDKLNQLIKMPHQYGKFYFLEIDGYEFLCGNLGLDYGFKLEGGLLTFYGEDEPILQIAVGETVEVDFTTIITNETKENDMLKAKLRKSIGIMDGELVKSGKKYNTYKMSFEDFDDAVEKLMVCLEAEIAVAWKVGCDGESVPLLKMEFIHQFATSVKVVSKNSGQTLLKWSEK